MNRRDVALMLSIGAFAGAVTLAARGHVELTKARRRVLTDALTGLKNRAGLEEGFADMSATRPDTDLSVALVDLDGFKPVNDTHGHAAGDAVLIAVAARMSALLPNSIVARLGGDEFVLVLPGTLGEAWVRAASVAAAIERPVDVGGAMVTVTASIGLAAAHGNLAHALAHADAAMYRAKVAGSGIVFHDAERDDRTSTTHDPRPADPRVRDMSRDALTMEVAR